MWGLSSKIKSFDSGYGDKAIGIKGIQFKSFELRRLLNKNKVFK